MARARSAPHRPGAERTSTIGTERATNTLLRAPSEDAFLQQLLASLGTFPPYFLRLGEINRRGPALVEGDRLRPVEPTQVARLRASGAEVVDVRPIADFGARHVPGSVSIPLRAAFATWLGWLVDATRPIVIVRNADQDPAEIVWQARKVGYDRIAGELAGGIAGWVAAGEPTTTIPLVQRRGLAGECSTSVRTASSPPGTCPAPTTSSSESWPPAPATCPPTRRW